MKTALVGSFLGKKYIASLSRLGYNVIKLPPCLSLDKHVCDHPDMIMFYDKDKHELIMPKEYYRENEKFFCELEVTTGVRIVKEEITLENKYPFDVIYDALSVKNVLYGKEGHVSKELLSRHECFIPVKQGYTRCSVALLNDECAITADMEIASRLIKQGLNVLKIRSGHISLSGYDYGFIGGAGGRLDSRTYCFFGDILSHPDGDNIVAFCSANKIKTVSLSDGPLSDNGGFIVF